MSSFNFGSLATTPTRSNNSYLKPYNIYNDVKVDSTEIKEGTASNGNKWKRLDIHFKNDEGTYTESIWYPKDGDNERKEIDMPNGGKRYLCSNFEVTMAMVAAIASAYNPEGFKKMQEISSKFRSFDDVVKSLQSVLDKAKDVTTSMKLIGRVNDGRVYARLPQPLGIAQDKNTQEWYTFPVAIFGDGLTFSSYEMNKKSEYENAKVTKMPETQVDSTEEEIDFDSLL